MWRPREQRERRENEVREGGTPSPALGTSALPELRTLRPSETGGPPERSRAASLLWGSLQKGNPCPQACARARSAVGGPPNATGEPPVPPDQHSGELTLDAGSGERAHPRWRMGLGRLQEGRAECWFTRPAETNFEQSRASTTSRSKERFSRNGPSRDAPA